MEAFFTMTYKEAIEAGIITDYKIMTIAVTDSEIAGLIERWPPGVMCSSGLQTIPSNRSMTSCLGTSLTSAPGSISERLPEANPHQTTLNQNSDAPRTASAPLTRGGRMVERTDSAASCWFRRAVASVRYAELGAAAWVAKPDSACPAMSRSSRT